MNEEEYIKLHELLGKLKYKIIKQNKDCDYSKYAEKIISSIDNLLCGGIMPEYTEVQANDSK